MTVSESRTILLELARHIEYTIDDIRRSENKVSPAALVKAREFAQRLEEYRNLLVDERDMVKKKSLQSSAIHSDNVPDDMTVGELRSMTLYDITNLLEGV